MAELILLQIDGTFTQEDHHRIAKIINLAATNAEIKALQRDRLAVLELADAQAEALQLESELTSEGITTRVTMRQEYNHGVGLIMGRELWISALPEDINDLSRMISRVR